MANSNQRKPDFSRLFAMYPEKAALVRRLLLSDPTFRHVCEDYLLLLDTIIEIDRQTVPRAGQDDCARLRTELELDIATLLLKAAELPQG